MKAALMMFIALAALLIGWSYASKEAKEWIGGVVRKNILQILLAMLVVVVAVVFSSNLTLRLI